MAGRRAALGASVDAGAGRRSCRRPRARRRPRRTTATPPPRARGRPRGREAPRRRPAAGGGGGELGLLDDAGRRRDGAAGRLGLEQDAREPGRAGDEDRRLVEKRGTARAVARSPEMDTPRHVARNRRARGQRLRAQQHEPPSRGARGAPQDAAGRRALCRTELDHDQAPLLRRPEELEVDARRDEPVVAREPLRGGGPRRLREREQRVDPAEQPFALCARGRVPSRSGEAKVATASALASRSARYERDGSAGSKPWTTSNSPCATASARFARTPTGTPSRDRRDTGTAAPTAITSRRSPRASARRPASRSPARVDGARTVTSWPRARSPRASPATCSFTSCGCDHANGVTRQILIRRSVSL